VNRLLYVARVSGLWLLGFGCFFLTALAITGFAYHVEFAQAVFMLLFPMSIVGLLSLSTARLIETEHLAGEDLHRRLGRHRFFTQFIGMISIFLTAMWGMFQNLSLGPFG
jgi:hypothetical protein